MDNDLLKKLKRICNSLSTDQLCHELNKVSSNYQAWNLESTKKILDELRNIFRSHRSDSIENKLKYIMKNHHDDKDIVIKCVLINGGLIDKASKRLLNDIDVARAAVLLSMDIKEEYTDEDEEYGYDNGKYAFKQISDELKNNKDFILEVIKSDVSYINLVSKNLLNDKDVVIAAGAKGLKATKTLKNDRDVLIAIAKNDPWFLKDASSSVRKNIEIVYICCRLHPILIQYAHPDLIAELVRILYLQTKKPKKI